MCSREWLSPATSLGDTRLQAAHLQVQAGADRIEVRLKPAEGQTLKQLYDTIREQYAARYSNVAKSTAISWSDGVLTARIKMRRDTVEMSFLCRL